MVRRELVRNHPARREAIPRGSLPMHGPPALYAVHQSDRVRRIVPRVPSPFGHWGKAARPRAVKRRIRAGGLLVVRRGRPEPIVTDERRAEERERPRDAAQCTATHNDAQRRTTKKLNSDFLLARPMQTTPPAEKTTRRPPRPASTFPPARDTLRLTEQATKTTA